MKTMKKKIVRTTESRSCTSTTSTASIWPTVESVAYLVTRIILQPKSLLEPTGRHDKLIVTCNDVVQVLAIVRHAAYAEAILINLMM